MRVTPRFMGIFDLSHSISNWNFLDSEGGPPQILVWATATGAATALAMLGKYYSIYLVAALVVAALAHPARWTYLRSPSPWVSAIVGIVTLAPHLHWLVTTGAEPFKYAYAVHGEAS
jgi:4-amino-4-deoxy-L-arabinose transferase-like glycosyltransferase